MLVQTAAIFLGVVAYMLLTLVDFRLFTEKNWRLLLAFNVLFILLLLTPLGTDHGMGNVNWLSIPGFPVDIQPNEIVKLPFILLLSLQITQIQEEGRDISSLPSLIQIGGHTVFMLGLIAVVCGDMGMCVIYMMIFVFMAWASGVKLRWFLLVGGGLLAAVVILWLFVLPETSLWTDYRIMRFRVVLDHDLDPLGKGYQQSRSILAIGSGQLFGQGYLQGIQTHASNSDALPERYNDFIFAVICEQLGQVFGVLLLAVYVLLILRGVTVVARARRSFEMLLGCGVLAMLGIQTFMIVAGVIKMIPLTGVTMPFLSYGGSSLLSCMAMIGILHGASARAQENLEEDILCVKG